MSAPAAPARLRGCALSLRMSQTVHGGRSNQQRHRYWQTEHTGAGLTLRHINQHPWTQANTREIGLIGAQGHLVIAAAGIIIPRGRVHSLLCQEFIIKHVEWVHTSFLSPSPFFDDSPMEKV